MTSVFDRYVARYGKLPTEFDPDYLEMLRMSKYRILEIPDVSPGKCGNCGASNGIGRKYVDIGLHIEWYGALFLCTLCLKDICSTAGLFEEFEKEIRIRQEELVSRETLLNQGTELQETVLSVFEEVKEHFTNLHSLSDDSGTDSSAVPVIDPPVSESGTNSPKSRTTKSTASSGSKDLPSLADLLKSNP